MSRPTVDQASKQNFVVNIQDSEFGKLVVRRREQDIQPEFESSFKTQVPSFSIWINNQKPA